MKTAGLATALYLAFATTFAPVAWGQDATVDEAPAAAAPATETPTVEMPEGQAPTGGLPTTPQPADAGPPATDAPPAVDTLDPGTDTSVDPQESVIDDTAEPAESEATFAMPDLPVLGAPTAGGVNYQHAATELARDTHWLSHWVHSMMAVIVVFVTGLLAVVAVRYNRGSNPTPARFTHNTKIEIAWTLVPVLILILIGSFSLPILFKQLEIPDPDLTVKVTGNQWYWNYEYPDNEMSFDSLLLPREDLAANGYADDLYLLATDTALVVPVGAVVKLQVTGADVIHSWTIPAFGVKMDAVPGRLNETWFQVDEPGVFFGQCSELCGKDHAFMPITVKALPQAEYDAWLDWAIEEYGGTRGGENVAALAH